jgi:uncharacterized protein RhaS with RHS repeats
LSWDPIGERGGINLYQSCHNNTLSYIDTNGESPLLIAAGAILLVGGALAAWIANSPPPDTVRNSDGTTSFVIHECEVVIVYGHGAFDKPHTIIQESNSTCGAGFIHCGATSSNNQIPTSVIVPGAPTSEYFKGDILTTDPEYIVASQAIQEGAKANAEEICKQKDADGCPKCKKVSVRFEYAPSTDALTNATDGAKPESYTIQCECDE